MSRKNRTIEELYTECDWCGKDILKNEKVFIIAGDFPTIRVHEDMCHRQAVATGIDNKK